jgi:glycosyltransferase involved in cell wall biosynthesis
MPMSDPLPLSISIITCNEEANLQRCLDSVAGLAREIVIIDSGSTDRTEVVAGKFGAVFEHSPWPGFLAQKRKGLTRCSQPWVLCLDADEALTPELAESIRAAVARPDPGPDGYELNRRTWYLGEWIWHAWYPEWRLRLVRRDVADWAGHDPHPALSVKGVSRRLAGDLLHYSFVDLQDHWIRTIKYARNSAAVYAARGRRFHWHQLLLSPWIAFIKHLVLKQGFRDGWRGWLISVIRGVDVFAKYAFLLELERTKPPTSKKP